jgi:CRISPR-associated protein Cas2
MPNATPRYMHLFIFFDLPVTTRPARREYARFRKFLLNEGFDMLQFSVYARLVPGPKAAARELATVEKNVPPDGHVRSLIITDQQYARMGVLIGPRTVREATVTARQLLLL